MLTEDEKRILRESWRLVAPIMDTAGDLFYRRLFELQPAYRKLFSDDMAAQKRKLIIPPSLAYGENPPAGKIPKNATLIFDVQVMSLRRPG